MGDDIDGPGRLGKRPWRRGGKPRRGPMRATPESLERAAHAYLARYAAPAEHLRRLLLARVARSARVHGTDAEAGAAAVDELIARLRRHGVLDDSAYAQALARSVLRRGGSTRAIRARLAAKGVARADAEAAVAALREEAGDPDLAAALAFARRKRLGPFRDPARRAERRGHDLAALGRQGFDHDVARRVIDTDDPAALEAEAKSMIGARKDGRQGGQ